MKKKDQIKLGIGIVVVTLGVGGYFYFKNKKPKMEERNGDASEKIKEEEIEDIPSESIFPLKQGSRGNSVKLLQQYLNRAPMCKRKVDSLPSHPNARMARLLPLAEDGIFGPLTEGALQVCYNTNQVDEKFYNKIKTALPKLSA